MRACVRACVRGWISLFSLPHDVAEILLTGILSINGINQPDGWIYGCMYGSVCTNRFCLD